MMTKRDALNIWTIYDNPDDVPGKFVARKWQVRAGGTLVATQDAIIMTDIGLLRGTMQAMGLVRFDRHPDDDPKIVEAWL